VLGSDHPSTRVIRSNLDYSWCRVQWGLVTTPPGVVTSRWPGTPWMGRRGCCRGRSGDHAVAARAVGL